jgi:hypothetical protein
VEYLEIFCHFVERKLWRKVINVCNLLVIDKINHFSSLPSEGVAVMMAFLSSRADRILGYFMLSLLARKLESFPRGELICARL